MLSRELEETLRRAMSNATDRNHEFATLEHLLLALVEDSDALEVLSACKVDIDELRARLLDYIETELTSICLLYTSPSPRDGLLSRMPSSA